MAAETGTRPRREGRSPYLAAGIALAGAAAILIALFGVAAETRIAAHQRSGAEAALRLSALQAARVVDARLALLAERARAPREAPPPKRASEDHSLLRRLGTMLEPMPDPLLAGLAPLPGVSAARSNAAALNGSLQISLPSKDGKGPAQLATLSHGWLESVLKGITGPERGYLIVAANGQVAGAAGSIGNLVFRSGERMPIIVLGAASARIAKTQPAGANEKPFDPPGFDATTGSSDQVSPWRVAGQDLLVSTAPVEPGLLVVALAPKPGLMAALTPILGLAVAPFVLAVLMLALIWRQSRALVRSEAQRKTSDELAEIMTKSAGCGLIDWDVEGGKIYWSAALMEMAGRPAHGAWLTLPETYQLLHPTEVPKLDRLRLAIAEGAPALEALIRLQSLQGRTIWCEARLRAWKDSAGQRIVGLLIDVTSEVEARIEAEAAAPEGFREDPALRATIEELEKKRTELADITQRHASEHTRAEDASRAKNEFLAHMSHELKTPLNAIIGFSEIMHSELYGTIGDERYREYARDIHAAGRALSQLIDDILEMSKIETGRITLDVEALDLVEIAETCVRLIEPRARESSIHIENRIKDAPSVQGDRRATKRILMNLLSNAVKFTQRGGRVTLAVSVDAENVTLSVADNGIGISQGDLSRIGRPFEQVENHQSRRHRGTGLGLAISMALSEMQGGALKIESSEGVGTTVFVTLPRGREQAAPNAERRVSKAG